MADRKKLIEVTLPIDTINREAAQEKSIRLGHPSTLHRLLGGHISSRVPANPPAPTVGMTAGDPL